MKTLFIANLILLFTSLWQVDTKLDPSFSDPTINRLERWLSYYNLKLSDFTDTIAVSKINIDPYPYDYWLDKNNLCKEFFISSPDSSYLIDLDSYSLVLEKDSKGQLVTYGGEIDTEVSLINMSEKNRFRILFCGPDDVIEEAYWLNDDVVFILGFSRTINSYFPTIWLYKISDKSRALIKSNTSFVKSELDYSIKTRLKAINFKYYAP